MKKEKFYNRSTSEMVRTLIEEGWKSFQEKNNSHRLPAKKLKY